MALFQKQVMMRRVIYALMPIVLFSIIQYGWQPLAVLVVSLAFGILTEYIFVKPKNKKVSEAVWVTCIIYALSLPPSIPLYLVPVGIIFAVAFGKMIFGGFGRNVVNPAISGRLLMYLTFPLQMTSGWMFPSLFGIDASAGATVLISSRLNDAAQMDAIASQPWWQSFVGWEPGSIGEGSALLIMLAAVYLISTKTANWRLMLATIVGFSLFALPISFLNISSEMAPLSFWLQLTTGSLLFTAVFMVTDPVTAPNKLPSMWVYGIITGLVTASIRFYAPSFPEGVSFGLLIANLLAPMIDEWFPKGKTAALAAKKKAASKPVVNRGKTV